MAGPAEAQQWGGWMEQIQELTDRNAELLAQLDSKDEEIAALEDKVIALEPVAGFSGAGDPRDAKIIELSKRNRMLNMGLQKKKSKWVDDLVATA